MTEKKKRSFRFDYCLLPIDWTVDNPIVTNSIVAWRIFFTSFTPILENSLMLFLACWNYELTSSVFANTVLFVSRPPVTKLSTIFVKVLPFTSALVVKTFPEMLRFYLVQLPPVVLPAVMLPVIMVALFLSCFGTRRNISRNRDYSIDFIYFEI